MAVISPFHMADGWPRRSFSHEHMRDADIDIAERRERRRCHILAAHFHGAVSRAL